MKKQVVICEKEQILNGTIVDVLKEGIVVKTGDGSLIIRSLQLEGKKNDSKDFNW